MKVYIKSSEGLDLKQRAKIAITTSDPRELAQLANDEVFSVRYRVAKNPNTPAEILAQLANDEDPYVRYEAARNSAAT